MTRAARRWLVALVEGRVCHTCSNGIIEPRMLALASECQPCRIRRIDKESHP